MDEASAGNRRWNAIAQAVTAVSQLLVTLLLVRLLDPADFGRVAVVYLVAGTIAVLDEGGLTTKLIAADERDPARLNAVFWQELGVGAVIALVLTALAGPIEAVFAQADLRAYLLALAPMFVVTAPRRYAQTLLFRDFRFRGMGIARIAAAVAFCFVTIGLAARGYGVSALVIGLITRLGLESVGFVVAARGRLRVSWPPVRSWRSGYGRSGVAKVGERFLQYGIDRVDLIIIGQVLGPTALGAYDVFKRLSLGFYQQIVPAFSRVALPALSRLRARPVVLAKAYARQLRYICLLLFPAYLFQAAFAPEIVSVVFGAKWSAYDGVFAWISLLLLVRSTNGPVDALLMARGWVRRELAYAIAAMGAVVGALLYAVGEGLEAAVASVTIINVAMCVPVYLWLVRPAGYVGRGQYLRAIGGPLGLATGATAVAYAVGQSVGAAPGPRLGVGLVVLIITFAMGLVLVYPGARRSLVRAYARWVRSGRG